MSCPFSHAPTYRAAAIATAILASILCWTAPLSCAMAEEAICYLGNAVDSGTDTGYSQNDVIAEDSPHFGWKLGEFYISGFTSKQKNEDGSFTFLKTAGDELALHFRLDQDITALNGNESLSVSSDENGYDEAMGVGKLESGFGRGTLIIRQTDFQNATSDPQVYTDYLYGIEQGADTIVNLFEEGDYEVALDYELKDDPRKLFDNFSVFPSYTNYTIRFKFSVRNGNTMAFLFDSETGDELTNGSSTPNGFSIDLAQSRYLDVNVKRETLPSNGDELITDTRQNGPAKDGEIYTVPGVYTITTVNQTTGETTEKLIYVGNDPILETYAADAGNSSISQIKNRLAEEKTSETAGDNASTAAEQEEPEESDNDSNGLPYIIMAAVVAAFIAVAGIAIIVRKNMNSKRTDQQSDDDTNEVADDTIGEGREQHAHDNQ